MVYKPIPAKKLMAQTRVWRVRVLWSDIHDPSVPCDDAGNVRRQPFCRRDSGLGFRF